MQPEKMEEKDGNERVIVLEQEVKSLAEELTQCQVRVNLSHLTGALMVILTVYVEALQSYRSKLQYVLRRVIFAMRWKSISAKTMCDVREHQFTKVRLCALCGQSVIQYIHTDSVAQCSTDSSTKLESKAVDRYP